MSTENTVLLLAVVLGFVQLFLATIFATAERGPKWNMGARDAPMPPLPGKAGRADRAFQNFKETFPFFLAAIFLVMQTGRAGNLSAIGAWLYLSARVVYIPLYVFDVTGVRTLSFVASVVGIALILIQSVIG